MLIIIGFLLELSKTVMSILKQNFFAYYMAVGSIFSCATWQSSCNILEASSRLGAAISGTGRQGLFYFILSPPLLVGACPALCLCWVQRAGEGLPALLTALLGWALLLKTGVGSPLTLLL